MFYVWGGVHRSSEQCLAYLIKNWLMKSRAGQDVAALQAALETARESGVGQARGGVRGSSR